MSELLNLSRYREDIFLIAHEHGARNVRVFGSAVRGDVGAGSDIDVLVDFKPERSLLDLVALKLDLEELLGCSVDVATEDALHWTIRQQVLKEARPFHEHPVGRHTRRLRTRHRGLRIVPFALLTSRASINY